MDRMIYTAMTGATAVVNRQGVLSHNLANAATSGFKAALSTYRDVPVQGEGSSTRVFALDTTPDYLQKPGPGQHTDRNMDVMAVDNAWFGVQALDGTEAYSRNGHLEVKTDGTLTSGDGLPILSSAGAPITVPPGAALTFAQDGSVIAKVGNQPAETVGRLKMVTPSPDDPFRRGADGLFRARSGDPLQNDATARLEPGVLEGSNVNAIETIVGMIQTARQFETQMRLLQTAESNDRTAGQLLNLQG